MARKKVFDTVVGVRVTEEERRKLQGLAEKTGLTVSATLKALIAAGTAEPVVTWRPTLGGGAK